MIQNLIQIGEPAEHRGIVVAPLFPRRDPVAAYVTLDEALAGGLRIAETSESGSVPELVVENPLAERVLLYDGEELVGAKQNRILNVSVLVEAKIDAHDPGLLRRAGALAARVRALPRGVAHLARGAPAAEGRDAGGAAARARGRAERGVGRRAGEGDADVRPLADRREPGPLPALRARAPGARGRLPGAARTVRRDPRDRGTTCASTSCPGRMPSRACGRSSGPATCSTRSSGWTGSPCRRRRSRRSWPGSTARCRARQPSAGLGEDVRLRGERVLGSGLELEGELIQLSAFRSDDGGRRAFGRIARPSRRGA